MLAPALLWAAHLAFIKEAGAQGAIAAQTVAAGAKSVVFDKLASQGRLTAIRINARDGDCTIERVVVSYTNGQVHYEDRIIALNAGGRRTKEIDPRIEERLVEQVELKLKEGSCTDKVVLEVQGERALAAKRPAVATQPATAKRPAVARRNIGELPPAASAPTVAGEDRKAYSEVDVFYGTNRQEEAKRKRAGTEIANFGPSPNPAGALAVGRATVTVPLEGREKGQINRPEFRVLSLSYEAEDINRHFTLFRVDVLERQAFIDAARSQIKSAGTFKDHAFVFVHGFNVSFDDALFRAAQLKFDMEFDGLAFVYSWPTRGNLAGYVLDRERAVGAAGTLREFVDLIQQLRDGPAAIKHFHFVGHSMGSQPLMDALSNFQRPAGQTAPLFGQVIFAASDVVKDTFRSATARISQAAQGVTLYASSKDWALTISRGLRIGERPVGLIQDGAPPFVAPGFDTIDVSSLETDFFSRNHSTYGDRKPLIDDMMRLFLTGTRPPSTRTEALKTQALPRNGGTYWRYEGP